MSQLSISNLQVSIEGKIILKGISLKIHPGEIHALMGPNGSGKSTLAQVIMGNEAYQVKKGKILLGKNNLLKLKPEERAKNGVLITFQNPISIPGVSAINFLKTAYKNIHAQEQQMPALEFVNYLKSIAKLLNLDEEFLKKPLNEGLSGGERKKMEALQIIALKPKLVLFDEIDTGTDVDALKIIGSAINSLIKNKDPKARPAILLITHYNKIFKYVKPDMVHIIKQGRLVKSGKSNLVKQVEKEGYRDF